MPVRSSSEKRVSTSVRRSSFAPSRAEQRVERIAMRDKKVQTHADPSSTGGAGVLRLFNVAAWRETLAALEEEFNAVLGQADSTTDQALGRRHKG